MTGSLELLEDLLPPTTETRIRELLAMSARSARRLSVLVRTRVAVAVRADDA
mgnify:CR=1 FL=1